MANALFDKARERFLTGQLDWITADIKVILTDTGVYSPNFASHEYLNDVSAGARIATSSVLLSKTASSGAADAADMTFSAVTGPSCEALIIYKDTGVEATSPLIAYIDTGTGLPITPNGGDIVVTWDNGINRIFRL